MLRLAADENLKIPIVRALSRRLPLLDIVRVQDAGLRGFNDPAVLEWATAEGRVLLTHDAGTMPDAVYTRIVAGSPTPGVLYLPF